MGLRVWGPHIPESGFPSRGRGEEPVFGALLPSPLPHLPSVLEAGWLSSRTSRNSLFLWVSHGWNLLARVILPWASQNQLLD